MDVVIGGNRMKNNPCISIIVPVYNVEKYLKRCIDSILKQTFTDFELILVDDGSTDASGILCDKCAEQDRRIRVLHKKNGGASSARNCGLDIAAGEYIAFVDSDDWVEPCMYECLYRIMKENEAQMAGCRMRIVRRKVKKIVQPIPETEILGRKELLDRFFRIDGVVDCGVWGKIISKKLLDNYRFIEGRMNEDIESGFYLAVNCHRAVYTNMIYYNYFKNRDGVTNSRFSEKKLDLLYIWDGLREQVMSQAPEYSREYELNCKRSRFTLLAKMYLDGYDKNSSVMKITKQKLKKEVRDSFGELMKWKMPISRKVLLVLVCILK